MFKTPACASCREGRLDNSNLFINLVFALGASTIGALVMARFRQSVILGFILAGIVVGPYTPGFVADLTAVQALADVGVVLLLFSIGTQLSFRELMRVGKVATLGGLIQVILTIAVGFGAGRAIGLTPLEALFLGAVVSNSSSTVLGKVLGERGEADSEHGRISLAWSSVQDMSTIVLVVVLSTLAVGGDGLIIDLLWAAGKALLFLALVVPLGSRIFPWLLERVASLQNREVFVLTVAAVALGTAFASSFFGLSLALGAFVGGLVVGESDLSHQVLDEVVPVRDVLAALFFVSVGMLIDPAIVVAQLPFVLVMLALIVVVKGSMTAVIAYLMGYPARTALLTGVTLAQSAEFSFLLARVGADVGVLSTELFSLILAGSAASIVLSPALHQLAAPLARWVDLRVPLGPLAKYSSPNPNGPAEPPLRGHAVICGFGRVGQVIGAALRRRGLSFVVIDQDPRLVRRLRAHGVPALLGNAANPILLARVDLTHARVLVVAIPDPLAARQIVDYARKVNPRLDIVVRTHSNAERHLLNERGVGEAVMGELELAFEMTRRTLRRFGVSALESLAIVQNMRERVELEPRDALADFFGDERS